jgi:hypothetical protein
MQEAVQASSQETGEAVASSQTQFYAAAAARGSEDQALTVSTLTSLHLQPRVSGTTIASTMPDQRGRDNLESVLDEMRCNNQLLFDRYAALATRPSCTTQHTTQHISGPQHIRGPHHMPGPQCACSQIPDTAAHNNVSPESLLLY